MREIKFRFWDKEENEWLVDSEDETSIYDFAFRHGMNWDHIDSPLERVVVMQYTGFKDRNGKEIYEGDILASVKYNTNELSGSSLRWEVYYNEDRLSFYQRDLDEGLNEPFWEFNLGSKQHVIIGNIYEYPEKVTD